MKESVDYGNWVPKNLLYSVLIIILILTLITLFPLLFLIYIFLLLVDGLVIIAFFYLFYLYYQFSSNNKQLQYKIWDLVIQKLPWDGDGKALDVGTGAGGLAIQLAKRFPNSRVWGIDNWGKGWNYSKSMGVKNAKIEGVEAQVHFQKASASNLPFKDGEFDAIVSNFVFHEVRDIKDKRKVIEESLRVLKKGGAFSLQDTFKNRKKFGTIEDLIRDIKEWGVEEINFIETVDVVSMPKLLKNELKKMSLLFGIK